MVELKQTRKNGFTVVELLVVIVVIGILASITVVAYSGIRRAMQNSQMEADLRTAAVQLSTDFSRDSKFPETKELANGGKGITASAGVTLSYLYDDLTNKYCLAVIGTNGVSFHLKSDDKRVISGDCSVPEPPVEEPPVVTPVPTDSVAWGGILADSVSDIVNTTDGGYAIAGTTRNGGAGGSDIFISKFAADGSLTWSRTWGTAGDESASALTLSTDNGYAVVGSIYGVGNGQGDVVVVKFAQDGSSTWNKAIGTVENDTAVDISSNSDGGYLITGWGFVETGNWDMFTAKLTATGVVTWDKAWGTPTTDYGGAVTQTTDGNFLSVGETTAGLNGRDLVIASYRSNGNIAWSELWGSKYDEYVNDVVATADGGAIIVGSYYRLGLGGALILKISSTGAVEWNKVWSGANNESFSSVALTNDGGIIAVGSTNSFGAGGNDMFIVKLSSTGTLLWNKTWGGALADSGSGVKQISSGSYIVVGNTSSFGTGGDVFIAKFNSDGTFNPCVSPMCKTPTVTLASLSGTLDSRASGDMMGPLSVVNLNINPAVFTLNSNTINTF